MRQGALELYDLEQDVGERKDLSKLQPEKTAELHRMLVEWRSRIQAPVPTEPNPQYDADLERITLKKYEK